jgi:hypothetical protein
MHSTSGAWNQPRPARAVIGMAGLFAVVDRYERMAQHQDAETKIAPSKKIDDRRLTSPG